MSFDPRRPFRRRTALEAGVTAKELRGPGFRTVLPGTYVSATTTITPLVRARAAVLPYGSVAWASHASAARVYDLPIPTIGVEHVSVPTAGQRRRHRGVKAHVGGTVPTRVVGGVRVSDPRMLFVEMASLLSLVDLVVLGDAMVRRRLVAPDDLLAWCGEVAHPAARAARRAAAFVRARVDSPMESRLRMLIVLAGLPEPALNVEVGDEGGEVVRRYDLAYPAVRVAIEYDGKLHVLTVEAQESDIERRDAIDDDGWRLLTVVSSGVYARPHATLQRIHRVLRARGLDGVPVRLGDAWRVHFPGYADVA